MLKREKQNVTVCGKGLQSNKMTTPPIHDGTKKWFENATIARKQKRKNLYINYINYIN